MDSFAAVALGPGMSTRQPQTLTGKHRIGIWAPLGRGPLRDSVTGDWSYTKVLSSTSLHNLGDDLEHATGLALAGSAASHRNPNGLI